MYKTIRGQVTWSHFYGTGIRRANKARGEGDGQIGEAVCKGLLER